MLHRLHFQRSRELVTSRGLMSGYGSILFHKYVTLKNQESIPDSILF